LAEWLNRAEIKNAIALNQPVHAAAVQRVLTHEYAPKLIEADLEKIGCDIFLIAAALHAPDSAVVTRKGAGVCQTSGVVTPRDQCSPR
jgi:hypothetical protein